MRSPFLSMMPPKTVLVADDEPEIRDLFAEVVRREGHRVLTASTGAEVLALANRELPDLILMDLRMPKMDGNEVLCRVRSSPALRRIPIVIISADCAGTLGEEARAAGCNECLEKPVEISDIRTILARQAHRVGSNLRIQD